MTEIIEKIISLEWEMFQRVENEGGRASCQDDPTTFYHMRKSQFSAWTEEICLSYLEDLRAAANSGRNLVEEKYARMMASTAPLRYLELEPFLPVLAENISQLAAELSHALAVESDACRKKYPHVFSRARAIYTSEDRGFPSLETYMRGEMLTYSEKTLLLIRDYMSALSEEGISLGERMMASSVSAYGKLSLAEAEKALAKRERGL